MTSIRIFDTGSRKKVPLEPMAEGKLGVYVCGPTVYDDCHIGHARCYVAFDTIVRHLRASGFGVTYVRNITDIDDKIINRANELGEDPIALAARFTAAFHADMQRLGNASPDVEPKVSDNLNEIVAFIGSLVDKDYAYAANGDVYFRVAKLDGYGDLSGRQLDEMRAGARVEVNEAKESPLDFALWKGTKPDEPSWDSPWGKGRPGWHIECSAMSERYLGESFDIHGGGADLIFPHHENEMAQSRAKNGPCSFSKYWLHNGFINLSGEKMSKSLGNCFLIRDVCKHHEPESLRFFLLGTHYRNPISFEVAHSSSGDATFPALDEAEKRLAYAYTTIARLRETLPEKAAGEGEIVAPADTARQKFADAMNDDFNTAAALGHCSELFALANKLLDQPKLVAKDVKRRTLLEINHVFQLATSTLGLFSEDPTAFLARRRKRLCAQRNINESEIEAMLAARAEARQEKDFAKSDEIRDELTKLNIEVMDRPGNNYDWRINEDV